MTGRNVFFAPVLILSFSFFFMPVLVFGCIFFSLPITDVFYAAMCESCLLLRQGLVLRVFWVLMVKQHVPHVLLVTQVANVKG